MNRANSQSPFGDLAPRRARKSATAIGAAVAITMAGVAPASAISPPPADHVSTIEDFETVVDPEFHSAPSDPPEIDPSRPMTDAEIAERLAYDRATYPEYFAPAHGDLSVGEAFWPGQLMWFVGKTALQFGLHHGFAAGLEKLMPGKPDPTAAALEQIADQIGGLRDQIAGVSEQVAGLGDQLEELKQLHEWNVYFDRESEVETHMGTINLNADHVAGYERHEQWDEPKARLVVSMTAYAIAQVQLKIVDGTDPAFQNLLKVLRYSEPDTRWAQIDAYRRSYESVLATGVLNIMAAHEKYPGLFQSELDGAVKRYEETIDALYEVGGVAYPQAVQFTAQGAATPVGTQLHPVGANYIVASSDRPLLRGEAKRPLSSEDEIESTYQALLDDYYRGRTSGDTSFGAYLRHRGFPSRLTIVDSVHVLHSGDWRVLSRAVIVQGREIGRSIDTASFATEAEAQTYAERLRTNANAQAPYVIDGVETNAAGHAISTDIDALDLALHGAPIDWNPDDAGSHGEMGPLVIEHSGYDTLVFVDADTGVRLGIFDVSKGPIDHAVVDAPSSASLALILGASLENAALEDGYVAPMGSTLLNLPAWNEGENLTFRPVERALERLHIKVTGVGNNGVVRVDGKVACGWDKGTSCTLDLDPHAGPLQVTAGGGSNVVLHSWGGACSGGQWNTCIVDPADGEQTVIANFQYFHHN